MQIADKSVVYPAHDKRNAPRIAVEPGEAFAVRTELASGDWLTGPDDLWSPEKSSACNPTVCVAVRGARPGDALAVEILGIEPEPFGYTSFFGGGGGLEDAILPGNALGLRSKTVRIEGGFVLWDGGLRIPIRPMIGTLGTAPAGEPIHNSRGGAHGGNMDAQEVRAGATVYLPVEVEGALLHVGDAHAVQGDGEIDGAGGIECRATVTLRARPIPRPKSMRSVRIEDAEHLAAAACGEGTDASFHAAVRELIGWMAEDYGFDEAEAYMLLAQTMEARETQFVNPTRTYVAKVPKWALRRG